MSWRRPRLRTVLIAVDLLILALPLGGIGALQLYENELVRRTEAELIGQGAFVAEAYRAEVRAELTREGAAQPVDAWGRPASSAYVDHSVNILDLRHRAPTLDRTRSPLLPPAPDPLDQPGGDDPVAIAAGRRIIPMLQRATTVTLSAVRVVGPRGFVVSSSRSGLDRYLGHWPEIERGLFGEPVSLMRVRRVGQRAPLESISRGTPIRVFVGVPVIERDRVWGVVVLSRTPLDVTKALYIHRLYLVSGALTLLAVVALVAMLTSVLINRPLKALQQQARQVAAGDRSVVAPPGGGGTQEIAELSEAIAHMARTLSARAQHVEAFASHVSHAFKAPLTSIRGSVELLQDHLRTMSPEQSQHFLANMASDTERLDRLVNKLMVLARAGAAVPGAEHTEVVRLAEEVVARHRSKGLEVALRAEVPEATVRMSAASLESVLDNLLDNAAVHARGPAGQTPRVTVTVDLQPPGTEGGLGVNAARIAVVDDGPGLAAEVRGRSFEPFVTSAGADGGTGLGLAIVRAMVQAHGGEASLRAETPHGTRVEVRLPLAQSGGGRA